MTTTEQVLQVLGVVRSPELQRELTETIGSCSGWTVDLRLGDLKSLGSDLLRTAPATGALLVDVDVDDAAEMDALGRLTGEAAAAGVPVLATASDLSAPSVRRLLRHGIADFIPRPLERRDVLDALQNLGPQKGRAAKADLPRGRVLTFSRATGGAGATTLAVNVAHALARPRGRRRAAVCLIDLDLHFGTVALQLDLPQTAGLLEIAQAPERLDAALFSGSLVEHRSGLRVLPAPSAPMPLEALRPDLVETLLELARAQFDYVVVDLPIALTQWTETVLHHSDLVYLVGHLNVPAVRQLRRLLDVIEEAGLYNLPIQLVLNRLQGGFGWGAGVKRRQAEKALGRTFDYCIRDQSEILNEAANRGCPVLDVRRYSRFGRQLRGMLKRSLQELPTRPGLPAAAAAQCASRSAREQAMFRHFEKRMPEAQPVRPNGRANPPPAKPLPAADAGTGFEFTDLKVRLHQRLLDMLNLAAIDKVAADELQREVGAIVRELLLEDGIALNAKEYNRLVEEILDEVLGLGPLEPLLKDPTVSDILVNTHARVFVERFGQLEATPVKFKDDRHLLRIIDKIVSAVGRRLDESQPWVDARLADGSRVNALIPPCAVDGPLLSIRKFSKMPFSIERLIEIGSMTGEMAEVLRAIVSSRLNVLISGGTGSGKTTMLNALSSFVSDRERIVTIEDTAELQLQQVHVARMETRPANVEGKGEVSQRDLVRNALRMRPDRIIVGEVRGAEVLDMLQAMNTGHEGSMTTIHANSARDALARLEHMVGMTGIELPMRSMRAQIASALHIVVQLQRMSDGRRRLISVQEITGMEGEVVSMQEIFRFERTGTDAEGAIQGHYVATGVRPKFARRFEQWGIGLGDNLFNPHTRLG